jgi:hypothetical protein
MQMYFLPLMEKVWVGQDCKSCVAKDDGCSSNEEDWAILEVWFFPLAGYPLVTSFLTILKALFHKAFKIDQYHQTWQMTTFSIEKKYDLLRVGYGGMGFW